MLVQVDCQRVESRSECLLPTLAVNGLPCHRVAATAFA